MEITKSTLWGAVALVVLAAGILGFRANLLAERKACRARLQHLVAPLDAFAHNHHGAVPDSRALLERAAGPLPVSAVKNHPFVLNPDAATLRWRRGGTPQPYLWDPAPHPFLNGFDVLATDGQVYTVERLGDPLRP